MAQLLKIGRRIFFLGHKKNEEQIEEDNKNLKENERVKELFFSCLADFQYKKEEEIVKRENW